MSAEAVTALKVTYHDAADVGRLAVMTIDDGHDHTRPTTLGAAALDSLQRALDELEAQRDVKGLLVTGKPFVFVAGADLEAFVGATPAFARDAARRGHEAFARLAALPFPTLAALNGVALGGGLELALHCDYRTVSANAAPLGFPEVFLSILPGWGGTQLAPRLLGAERALRMIVHHPLDNNRTLTAAQAHELGLVDRLLEPVDFLEQSLVLLERLVTGAERIVRPPADHGHLDALLAQARQAADDRTHGATPAPYRAIECVEVAARGGDLAEGRDREIEALAELLPGRHAQASVYAFDLTQRRVRKQPWRPAADAREVRQVGVVGAGLMGAQLGALLLHRYQVPLVVKDVDEAVLQQARQTIEDELDRRVQRGRLAAGKAGWLKSVVTYTRDYAPMADCDLVIEAVVEELGVKQRVFADLEEVVDATAVLATNTSSLSVATMATGLAHPERVVGLHFFNPVAVMPLLEVVRTGQVGDEAMATAFAAARTLRKSAVQCGDAPGFVVNRVLMRFMAACSDAASRGNDFAEVDDAVKALGLPMGPFELLGLIGLRVGAHVARTMHEAYPDRFPRDDNVERLGATDLPGVYDWSRGRVPFEEVRDRWEVRDGAEPLTAEQIRTQALEAVADEVAHLLDEGVVADARDVDTCMLLGAGWPFFNGGICKYLDQTGISEQLRGARLIGDTDGALAS